MPCNSDYLAVSGQELESMRVCDNICYLYQKLAKPIPDWIQKATKEYDGNLRRLDEATQILCSAIRTLTPQEMETYVYNAHSQESRKLASWWERHREWDTRRVKEEDETRRVILLKDRAIAKLTVEEREALGLL